MKRSPKPKFTEEQLIRALRDLEKRWPPDLWLLAGVGGLNLIRGTPGVISGSLNEAIVEHFLIPADGGDPF